MTIALWPLLLALLGGLIYFLSDPTRPKLAEVGRLLLAVSLLWLVYMMAGGKSLQL